MKKHQKHRIPTNEKERIENLRGNNRKLQKELSRLRKQLLKKDFTSETEDDSIIEDKEKNKCPKCESLDCIILDLGIRRYLLCHSCGKKERLD